MSVVVEHTIPFSSSALDLQNPQRWNALLPLIRPSLVPVQTAKGQTILIDRSHTSSRHVHVAAVGRLGNFSSKLLDDRDVTSIITEQQGAGILTASDIVHAMNQAGIVVLQGVVVVRSGNHQRLEMHGTEILEIETSSELEFDHAIHLLDSATESCRTSIHLVAELLRVFQKDVSATHSRFDSEKLAGSVAIKHVDGSRAFEKARHAIKKDLNHVLKSQVVSKTVQNTAVVSSVHYSDINGLSRLENYILAGEIGQMLETRNLPFKLSHSTILDHAELARGFAMSVCAVPAHYLTAQSKAEAHRQSPRAVKSIQQHISASPMSFSDALLRKRIVAGCEAVIKAEPTITEYDTIVGDGDCGYTLRDGAKQVMQFIQNKDLAHLPQVVSELVQDLEVNMGGTSGALYCIFLTALASSLASEAKISTALKAALRELLKYTKARLGDRTMMDALIPFVETLEATGDAGQAVQKARDGVDSTKNMEASLGRSSYLDESAIRGVPDPGAYSLLVLLEGMTTTE